MCRNFLRQSSVSVTTLLMGVLSATNLSAQQPKVLAPHRPIPQRINEKTDWSKKATRRSLVGGLWMTDANFKSSIYLRSVVESDPITVTPILWLANGTKYTLPDVTLERAGTAIIDINAGLQSKGISSWATLNGYVELQYTWAWDPLCATIRDVDVAHSLIFTYGLRSTTPLNPQVAPAQPGPQAVQGMWWKEVPDITGFVALANVSSEAVQATLQVSDPLARSLTKHTVTVSPHGMKLVNLPELPQIADAAGGLRITYTGPADALIVNGGVEDENVGYSAVLPFASRPLQQSDLPPYAKLTDFTSIAELGLMVAAADPMMNFPANTTFKPYSILRNVSDSAAAVTPTIWWMQGGAAHSARLQQIQLQPQESRSLDVTAMLALAGLANFNGNFNLVFEGDLKRGSLIAAAGSVDQTKTYVFEVTPRGVAESASKSLQYWSTGNGDDTMITLWNPADEAQDLLFKVFFSGGHYLVPIHLDPRATRTINISEITQNAVPDAEGNTIPPSIHEGGAKITGSHADNENILVAIDAGIYNVRKATCGTSCYTCDGYSNWSVELNPFSLGVKGQYTLTLSAAYDNNGGQYSFAGTWNSGNTSVATVGSSTGTAKGVSHGSVSITSYVTNSSQAPVYAYICSGGPDPCPVGFGGGGGSTGNVFQVTNVLPNNLVLGSSGVLTIYGQGFTTLLSPTAQFDASSGITTGTPSVANDTTMTVSYQVTCSSSLAVYNLTIGDSIDGGISGTTWPETVILPQAPMPTIKLGGNSISGTQSVVVGQQVALSASVSLPACMSISNQQWSTPPGTANGGYSASVTSGSVTPLPASTNSSYTFYWVTAGNSLNMTFQYTMSGGGSSAGSPVSTATFNVVGPTGGKMTTTHVGTVGIQTINGQPYLQFGTSSATNAGVLFTPSATAPNGYSNNFTWVQMISGDTMTFVGSSNCNGGTGLDNVYPFPPVAGTNQAGDSPAVQLLTSDTQATRTFSAQMYLLWSSGLANSIPVPIGSVAWSFSGTATKSGSTWSATGSGSAGSFVASTSYPTWTTHVTNGVCQSDTN